MSKFKFNPAEVSLEQKVQILKEVEELAVYFLYTSRDLTKSKEEATKSPIATVSLFQLLNSKTITTGDIINTFAKALRKEID